MNGRVGPTKAVRIGREAAARLDELRKPWENYAETLHRILVTEARIRKL